MEKEFREEEFYILAGYDLLELECSWWACSGGFGEYPFTSVRL